ncbi:MAG: PIN domain-containing protein, partial [Patescibacteria group bacterium]
MGKRYLADTTVFVDALRGVEAARAFLSQEDVVMSCISVAELIEGCRDKRDLRLVTNLCNDFEVIQINSSATA